MSKIKKILCMVLLITMCIPQTSFALEGTDTYYINENFNSSTGSYTPGVDNWRSVSFTPGSGLDNGLQGGTNRTSVATAQTDMVKGSKSFTFKNLGSAISLWVNFKSDGGATSYDFEDGANLEFSFKVENIADKIAMSAKDKTGAWWHAPITIQNGTILITTVDSGVTYEAGKWYHLVLSIDPTNSKYKLYLNNELKKDNGTLKINGSNSFGSFRSDTRFELTPAVNSTVWFDDVKLYTTEVFGYDAAADGAECSVTSENENYIVDEDNDTVSVPFGTKISDLIDELTFPSEDISFCNLNNVIIEDSSYNAEIFEKIKIIVRSENGAVVKEYIVGIPDERSVIISSETLTIDHKNGIISEVDTNTTKEELLAAVTPPHEDAVIEIVDDQGNSYNEDSLIKNLCLKVTSADGTSSKLYSIVFKATFFSDTVCLLLGSKNLWIDDEKATAQMPVTMVGNSVMLPAETLAEISGEELAEDSNTVEIGNCSFVIGESKFLYDGSEIQLAEKIQRIDGAVYIPLKEYVTEVLDKHYSLSQKGLIVIGNDSQTSVQGTTNADKAMQMLNYLAFDRPNATALQQTVLAANHPRAFAKETQIDAAISRKDADQTLKQWSDNAVRSADVILNRTVSGHVYNDTILNLYWAYKVTGDTKYAAKAEAFALHMAQMQNWEADSLFLTTEAVCMSTALVYDLFNDYLGNDSKEIIAEGIKNNALIPAQEYYSSTASSAWPKRDNNWNIVCNSGVIVGAIAIMDAYPELCADVLEKALTSLEGAMHNFSPDGGWFEGVGYWEYTVEDMVMALAALETACGTTYGITEIPGMMDTAYFPIYFSGNPYIFGYHDVDPNTIVNTAATMWFANKTQDMNLQKYRMEQISTYGSESPVKDLLWYSANEMPAQAEFNLDAMYSSADVATMRSDWSRDAVIANIHAGENDVAHGQLDIGDFEYEVWGTKFADEMCKDDYELDGYFDIGGQRNDYYVNRAEGQNVYVINPSEDGGQKTNASSEIVKLQGNSTDSIYTIDMTPAYASNVESALRGFMLSEDRKVFTVQDEITPKNQDDEYYWYWHTKSDITIGEDGKTVTLTDIEDDSKTVKLYIDCNVDFDVTKGKAIPAATSPSPEGQLGKAHHLAMNKITVNFLSDSDKVTLRVTAVPCDVSYVPGEITPIEEWSLYNNEEDDEPFVPTYHINENFNSSTGSYTPGVDNWRSVSFTPDSGLDNGLQGGTNRTSVATAKLDGLKGTKAFTFKNIGTAMTLWVNFKSDGGASSYDFPDGANLEFSFKAENLSDKIAMSAKDKTGAWWHAPLTIQNGKILITTVDSGVTYEAGKWYHLVLSIDPTNSKYKLYLNNELKKDNGTLKINGSNSFGSFRSDTRFEFTPAVDSTVWFDDVKLYTTSRFGYDTTVAENQCYIESTDGSGIVTVDEENTTVTIKYDIDNLTKDDIEILHQTGKLTWTGNVVYLNTDGDIITADSVICVRSASGIVVKEYAVKIVDENGEIIENGVSDEDKTIITADRFTVDRLNKVITDIEYGTTAQGILDDIQPPAGADMKVVDSSGEEYAGILSDGMFLQVISASGNKTTLYSLDCKKAAIKLPQNNNGVTRDKTVEIGITAIEGITPDSVVYYINGEEIQGDSENKAEYTFDSEGTVEIYAVVTTAEGETIETSVKTLTYANNKAPIVVITNPADGYETEETSFDVSAKATDEDGSAEKLRLYIDGELYDEANGEEYTFALTDIPVGTHFLYAEAIDNEGGIGISQTITVYIKETYLTTISETDFSGAYDWTVFAPNNFKVTSELVTDDNEEYGKCLKISGISGAPYMIYESTNPLLSNADVTLEMDIKVSDLNIILKMFSINTTEGEWINSSGFEISNGVYGSNTVLESDTWHHVKYKFNLRSMKHEFSIDNEILKSGSFTSDKDSRTFKNIRITLNKSGTTDSSLYVDNIKITANAEAPMLSSIEYLDSDGNIITPVDGRVDNKVKTVKLIFNNELMAEDITAETVKVYGLEDRVVDATVVCDSENASDVLITLNEQVKSLCGYKIIVDEGIEDIYGNVTLSDTVVQFETTPNTIDVTKWEIKQGTGEVNLSQLEKGDTITLYATISNDTASLLKNRFVVFTAFSNNKMIGYAVNDTWEVPAHDSITVPVTITLTEDFSSTPTLHGYLWDSLGQSNPIATRYLMK